MLKIPSKLSITLSMTFAVALALVIIIAAVLLPSIVGYLVSIDNYIEGLLDARGDISGGGQTFILAASYVLLAIALIADTMLFFLLVRVRRGLVFTDASVSLIRGVSWCCFFAGVTVFAMAGYFQVAYIIGCAAFFLGLCLHVVKNVIEEATRIKNENDLTV